MRQAIQWPRRLPNTMLLPPSTNNRAIRMGTASADKSAHMHALREAARAPSMSPALRRPSTWAAYTIDTMPSGRQQNSVVRIA